MGTTSEQDYWARVCWDLTRMAQRYTDADGAVYTYTITALTFDGLMAEPPLAQEPLP